MSGDTMALSPLAPEPDRSGSIQQDRGRFTFLLEAVLLPVKTIALWRHHPAISKAENADQ
jgi:hypothetical protein